MIRLGIIGTGGMAQTHAENFSDEGRAAGRLL
jgi:predicted dehydrogenase